MPSTLERCNLPEWTQLERDVATWLSSFANNQIEYRNSYQAIPGFASDGSKSDGLLTCKGILLAVEIEVHQAHPDTNVGKYWFLHNELKAYKKIVLFHIYTPDFNSYGWRMRLGEFYARKMQSEVPIEYVLLDHRGAKDYDAVLRDIKTRVADAIRREFGSVDTR